MSSFANVNKPLPLGSAQTISQPLTVAFMLELLQPAKGNRVLEIGGGSGWQTAILSDIVGKNGKIYSYEIVRSLTEFGKHNLGKFQLENVVFEHRDVSLGYPEEAPYNKIISGAAFEEIPQELKEQLEISGTLVAPTKADDVRRIRRTAETEFKEEIYPGFAFVPIRQQL